MVRALVAIREREGGYIHYVYNGTEWFRGLYALFRCRVLGCVVGCGV